MKKNILLLVIPLAFSLPAASQLKVPEAVSNTFNAKFPNAKDVKWEKENAKELEAVFNQNGNAVSANFKMDGTWVETETVISVSALPAAVGQAIQSKYPGATVSKAEKIEKPVHTILYEVLLNINGKTKAVELDEKGRFLK